MKKEKTIRYQDLSTPLKVAVVGAWIVLTIYVVSFLVGFIAGSLGGYP